MDHNQNYLLELLKHNDNEIESLRPYAEDNHVPIVDKLTLELIKQLIRMHKTTYILEIGTAIGYSAMHFASVSPEIEVTTIERDETMQQRAKHNISAFNYDQQIRQIHGDALEVMDQVADRTYDMVFIDAEKAQSQKFFERYTPYLREGGLVITDNVLYHDFVANIDAVKSRNKRQMAKKINAYNKWLMEQTQYATTFLNMDDGVAISIKGASV